MHKILKLYRPKVYLDYAAATPVSRELLPVIRKYHQLEFYNASSLYLSSNTVSQKLDEARHTIAARMGVKKDEIIFTSGATESNNLAIKGVMNRLLSLGEPAKLLISAVEHPSVYEPAQNYDHQLLTVDEVGRVNLKELEEKVATANLVSIILANNETGVIQRQDAIAKIIEKEKQKRSQQPKSSPLYFHMDMVQAVNYMKINLARMKVDLATFSSGKIYGPKGVGALYVKAGVELEPLLNGGGQQLGLRPGTEPVAQIMAFAKSFDRAQENFRRPSSYKRNWFIDKLQQEFGDKITINGLGDTWGLSWEKSRKSTLPNIINVSFLGHDNHTLCMQLDELNIQVSVGSACSVANNERSRVLQAMGKADEVIDSSIRISFGKFTKKRHLRYVLRCLKDIINT